MKISRTCKLFLTKDGDGLALWTVKPELMKDKTYGEGEPHTLISESGSVLESLMEAINLTIPTKVGIMELDLTGSISSVAPKTKKVPAKVLSTKSLSSKTMCCGSCKKTAKKKVSKKK